MVVVIGAAAPEVRLACTPNAILVVNEAWSEGMGGSLGAGLIEARRRESAAAVVLPVDQPVVTAALITRLIEAWRKGARAAVAAYRGLGRTPVVLDQSLWRPVEAAAVGDVGARGYLRSHPELVTLVDCDDVGDGSDIDTPEDLPRLEDVYRRLSAACTAEDSGS